jgi:MYXO-CTERM domain-containing protein
MLRRVLLTLAVVALPASSEAAVIHVSPSDSFAKIEAANPGDEVIVAPGTYTFRLFLTKQAPANAPIHIHAEDPSNPPVWDFGSTPVENAPGSYGGGDDGRGCWMFSGATNYLVEGIVFTHCTTQNGQDSAGIRYYEGTRGLVVRDCVFRANDNGLTGGTQDSEATVEFCEFDHNGNLAATQPTHNIYIYGGTFTMRYSWLHDPTQGQNFHVRAHTATLEYNWFARAASYAGDLMTNDDYANDPEAGSFAQTIVLRGNVFLEGSTQNNDGQIFVLYNDTKAPGLTMSAHVLYNTFVGDGNHSAFVHLSNADGTTMSAQVDDNVIYGTTQPTLIVDATHGTVTGKNNWLATGVAAGPLAASVQSADPGFVDPAGEDYHLKPGSACIGGASSAGLQDLPDKEYWQDEKVTRMYRARATVADIGAFESTTMSTPVGPYGGADGGGGGDGGTGGDSSGGSSGGDGAAYDAPIDEGGTSNGGTSGKSGCGCAMPEGDTAGAGAIATLALGALFLARRRRSAIG